MSMWILDWIRNWIRNWFPPPPIYIRPYERTIPLDTLPDTLHQTDDHVRDQCVSEHTPSGEVIMMYTDMHFVYWADKPIAYKYLETVARKYVILFHCKDLYINLFKELHLAYVNNPTHSPWIVNKRSNQYKHAGTLASRVPIITQRPYQQLTFMEYKKNLPLV